MAKYGMAINLDTCVGCGACAIACKTENNTEFQRDGQSFNWADFLTITEGSFANGTVKFKVIPVLCNHCSDAPCVEACPVTPKAMYKTEDGITMHNDDLCIGCQMCQAKCPYSSLKVVGSSRQYSVISYNSYDENTHPFWDDESSIIAGGTSSPAEVAEAADFVPPFKHDYSHPDYHAVRPPNVTEKCIFCDHRLKNGELPYCVVSCPAGARIFGDLDDPESEINQVIANGYLQLKNNKGEFLSMNEAGTRPNVFYVGQNLPLSVEEKEPEPLAYATLKVYPNPAVDSATAEYELKKRDTVSIQLYSVAGKLVRTIQEEKIQDVGFQKVTVNLTGLSSGSYILTVSSNHQHLSANIIKR